MDNRPDDVVNIEITVRTNKVGSECSITIDFDREDWEQMTDDDKQKTLLECLWDSGMIDWDWEEKP